MERGWERVRVKVEEAVAVISECSDSRDGMDLRYFGGRIDRT